jgi:hypothetical protein
MRSHYLALDLFWFSGFGFDCEAAPRNGVDARGRFRQILVYDEPIYLGLAAGQSIPIPLLCSD